MKTDIHWYPRLAARLFNSPLLLDPDKANTIAAVFNAFVTRNQEELEPFEPPVRVDLAASMNMRRAEGGYYVTSNGVGVVQVYGALMQRADGLDALSGNTGYNDISARMAAAARDPGVHGIVMEFDSPGGEVEGVVDAATRIAEVEKPVWAHANGIALSGAYWLAAAADRIYATPTGLLGSIGVLIMHADRSRIIERSGVVYTPIYAGARKVDGAPHMPLSEEARTWAQNRVDEIYAMFVDHVAGNRGMDEGVVRGTEAELLSTAKAMELGLADGTALLGETVQMMADELYSGQLKRKMPYRRAAASAYSQGDAVMSTAAAKDNAAGAVVVPVNAISQADLDREVAAATLAATKAATDKATTDAKARIGAITESDAGKVRPLLAKRLAFDTDMTVEAATKLMEGLPEEVKAAAVVGNALAERMAAEAANPVVGASGDGSGDGEADEAKAMATRVAGFARRRPLAAVK